MRSVTRFVMLLCLLVMGQSALAQTSGTVTYVYTDPQGTPLAEADASGTITATFDYTPYGTYAASGTSNPGPDPNGPGYTGHVNDPETNLIYMQSRYYDSATGHFLSVDPIVPSAANLFRFGRYAYANNNPIFYTDPTGQCGNSGVSGTVQAMRDTSDGCDGAMAEHTEATHTDHLQDKQSGSTVTTNTYSATATGVQIVLIGTISGGSYTDSNWVQTVTTNDPLKGKPANLPYPDTDPGQMTPFYLNPKEQAQFEAIAKTVGGSTIFTDQPSRNFSGKTITWHANLSLVGINKDGSFDRLKSFTYGFTIDAAGVHVEPLRPTQ